MQRKGFKAIKLSLPAAIVVAGLMASCAGDPLSPGVEFMPDMYRSVSAETYKSSDVFADSITAQKPVEGTIPRGFDLYPYPNTQEGYELAGAELKNPIAYSEGVVKEGKVIYGKFCIHCHGEKGQGDGTVPTTSDYPPPPAYNGGALKDLPEGKMYHTLQYGKGMMGSHASQISQEDRWKLVHYVQTLQKQ